MTISGRLALAASVIILLPITLPDGPAAQSAIETIEFNGPFIEGEVIRDQYMFRGVRFPADPNGGPFYDDGGGLAFLLDTPPGLLSLSPFSRFGGPGAVHASVGTYVFDFVDPSNPFAPSFTDRVDAVVVLVDKGDTVLTAFDADGNVLGTRILTLADFSFDIHVLSVTAPGIRKATLTTPLVQPTLGCLVDTLHFESPAVLPARPIDIDVRPGPARNVIRLAGTVHNTVPVAILSSPGFDPGALEPAKILFQRASPVSWSLIDRNHDRARDLVLNFRVLDLKGLTTASTEATLTAVDADGTPLKGTDAVIVLAGPSPPTPFAGAAPTGRPALREGD